MNSLPLRFELSNGKIFTGTLERMDTGSTTPTVFYIKELRPDGLYHAGELVRYIQTNEWGVPTGESYWQASGVLAEFSEALGMMVEGIEWDLH